MPDEAVAEQDLHRRALEELADVAVILLDADGKIAKWSGSAQRLTGYTEQEIAGMPPARLCLPAESRPQQLEQYIRQARDAGRVAYEGWLLRKNGTRFWAAGVLTPFRDKEDRLIGFCDVIRDISHRKGVEEELLRSTTELEQVASVVSHDLRSPLLAISGCAQLLKEQCDESLPGEAAELLGMIQDSVNRMGLIIKDLLAFARATSARDRPETVETENVLAKSLAELRKPIDESMAVVTHDPLPIIKANAGQLALVLINLIGNAIKFRGPQPPCIHVSAVENPREWEFSVRDNGIGIEPVHFERIFTIFQRLHEEGKYEGSGAGLAICKKIVEHHHGRIWVQSQPGRGSTFFFTIPKSI